MQAISTDRIRFPFLDLLESRWREIRDEALALNSRFIQYPQTGQYTGSWEVFGLYDWGTRLDANCELCPVTASVIDQIPGVKVVGFSRLAPDTHIAYHKHPTVRDNFPADYKYLTFGAIAHLGLVVPPGCLFRIEKDFFSWREGKAFCFDPTMEHEVWSKAKTERIVLFIDFDHELFWRRDASRV